MRQRITALALALAGLAACAPTAPPPDAPVPFRDIPEDAPLDARLYSGGIRNDHLWISVNQPAYVAVFQLRSGQGVALIHPDREFEHGQLLSGGRWLDTYYTNRRFWHLTSATNSWFGSWANTGMQVYLLVASKRPMRELDRFLRAPESIRSVLGNRYNSVSDLDVADALVQHIVPPQPDADWTTDVLVVWPNDRYVEPYAGRLITVRCSDGSVIVVPERFAAYACRQRESNAPPVAPDSTNQPDGVERPSRRRPEPVERPATPETERETIQEVERRDRPRAADPQGADGDGPRGRGTTGTPAGGDEPRREPAQPVERRVERPSQVDRPERPVERPVERPAQRPAERPAQVERPAPPPPPPPPPSPERAPTSGPTGSGRMERPVP